MTHTPLLTLIAIALATTACLDLDGFAYNPVHCSNVDAETCAGESAWDRICTPCDEPYDWGQDHPWFEQTLEPGQTIRPIDDARVTQASITTEDGEGSLDLYLIESHGEVPELADTTILYNHGNYAGIEHYIPRVRYLHEAGYTVIVWDYRGYGKSLPDTTPTSEQLLADARQIRDEAARIAPDPDRVIVYANSLGGIPSVEMALHDAPCALFLEAAFTSIHQITTSNTGLSLPEGFLSQGRFNNTEKIRDVTAPLFVMHGSRDNKFPVEDARELFDNAGSTEKDFWELPGVMHGIANVGVPEAGYTEYIERMRGFLDDHAPSCLAP